MIARTQPKILTQDFFRVAAPEIYHVREATAQWRTNPQAAALSLCRAGDALIARQDSPVTQLARTAAYIEASRKLAEVHDYHAASTAGNASHWLWLHLLDTPVNSEFILTSASLIAALGLKKGASKEEIYSAAASFIEQAASHFTGRQHVPGKIGPSAVKQFSYAGKFYIKAGQLDKAEAVLAKAKLEPGADADKLYISPLAYALSKAKLL